MLSMYLIHFTFNVEFRRKGGETWYPIYGGSPKFDEKYFLVKTFQLIMTISISMISFNVLAGKVTFINPFQSSHKFGALISQNMTVNSVSVTV